METPINQAVKYVAGGDFMNRSHESFFHQTGVPTQTMASLHREHQTELAEHSPREALAFAERFCRHAQVTGAESETSVGFDWVMTPSRFSRRVNVELGTGGFATLIQTEPGIPVAQLDATLHAGVAGHPRLAQAYAMLPAHQRSFLLGELQESLEQVQANRVAADRLESIRGRRELPLPLRFSSDGISRLLQRYDVPEEVAMDTATWLAQTHGDRLSGMHVAEVLGAAYVFNAHPSVVSGPPWQSWLCECIAGGNANGMEACLSMGADSNVPNSRGDMPLHIAARLGRHGVVLRLLEVGADPTHGNPHGETPLHLAAEQGHADVCLALLGGGADPGQLDFSGRKPGTQRREAVHAGL
ncbi:ankyrin repeat domain-containing protein [Stenotrophomonas sp. CFBP 13725]|uniref:ankyrin repeat domain-containing protein n=1 Tax=Stenotrophomonas sp. CFBP 13725 TaxID=2775297 RepID=UPI001780B589|nr:ankyrin repeat domain-containing protein [Stenotrophomonas sp. CFBP 13725]MBD8636652.1 ankyrin repeat domain-containing protein [Stenotrophomonas sp. CFBP 13725]